MLRVSSQKKNISSSLEKIQTQLRVLSFKINIIIKKKLKGVETQVLAGVASLAYHDYSQA